MFENVPNAGDSSKGTEKAINTKAHLLQTSLRLFQKRGFEKTTMRDIASEAGIALGSTYYYFKGKDEIVFAFYQHSLDKTIAYGREIFSSNKKAEKKLELFFEKKIEEMSPYRNFLKNLAASSLDATNPLSPFSRENQYIKNEVIQMIQEMLECDGVKAGKEIKPIMGSLAWHLQMALMLYWIHDTSKGQENSQKLLKRLLKVYFTFLTTSNLPVIRSFNKNFVETFKLIGAGYGSN